MKETLRFYELQERAALLPALVAVWEDSVQASHTFLSKEEIAHIKTYVPQALQRVEHLVVAESESGTIVGFLGVTEQRLEMLFLAPEVQGQGIGKALLQYGMERYGIQTLTVNEQNPQAVGFYEHMGFQTYRRTEQDEAGDPYPLLYMKRRR